MPLKTTEAAATTKTKKSVVRRASTKKTTEAPAVLTWEHVAVRAYYMSLESGDADPVENWLRAERELATA